MRGKDGLKLEAKEVIGAIQSEIQTGDINNFLLDSCPGLTPEMARVMTAGVLAKAITYGMTIPSVLDEYVTAWKEANHGA
jgi:hypothetical protein